MEYDIGYNFLSEIKEELKKIYNLSIDLIGIQKNILDCINIYGNLFFVIDDYTTLSYDEIVSELKKLVKSKDYLDLSRKHQLKINEEIDKINGNVNFSKDLFLQYQQKFDLSKPILIDQSEKQINYLE